MQYGKAKNILETIKIIIHLFICGVIIVIIIILTNQFISKGIEWKNFIEFIVACFALLFILNPNLASIKIPGILEIERKLNHIDDRMVAMQNQILTMKLSQKVEVKINEKDHEKTTQPEKYKPDDPEENVTRAEIEEEQLQELFEKYDT